MTVYPKASPNKTSPLPGREIRYIVVHYTADITSRPGTAEKTAIFFSSSGIRSSADFIVDDEEVVLYNPDPANRFSWHCGEHIKNDPGGKEFGLCTNENSLGIEICSSHRAGRITVPNDPCYYFTAAVLERAAELIAFLMEVYHIDTSHVVRHYDVTGALCPGITGWNEASGSAESWYAFLDKCKSYYDRNCKNPPDL